ncbi:MAG: Rpp14/Pop5 family protein [Candidatus Micrarchaeia archaeon]
MKRKYRYILVMSLKPLNGVDERDFYAELMRLIGELHFAEANPKIARQISNRLFVLKISLSHYEEAIAALALIKRISGIENAFYTIYASGTLKAIEKYIKSTNMGSLIESNLN